MRYLTIEKKGEENKILQSEYVTATKQDKKKQKTPKCRLNLEN